MQTDGTINLDFVLPDPTIDEAEAERRYNALGPLDRLFILGLKASTPDFNIRKLLTLVEHIELAKKLVSEMK